MLLHAFHRRFISGIVLFALMLQMVLPAIAGAAAASGERWIEVCAASGVKWVKLDHDQAGGQHASADHCMLCAATGATPEFDSSRYLNTALAEAEIVVSVVASYPTYPSHLLRSRAPPQLS